MVSGTAVVAAAVVTAVVVSGIITVLSAAGAGVRFFTVVVDVVVSALVVAVVCTVTSASVDFLSSCSLIVVVSGVFSV